VEIAEPKDWSTILKGWLPGVDEATINSYAQKFVENHIHDVETLSQVESSELKDLKISTGHRTVILDRARREARGGPVAFNSVCGDLGLKLDGQWNELTSLPLWQGVVGEFLASGVYVFILNSIIVSSGILVQTGNGADDSLSIGNLTGDRYLSIAIGAGFAFAVAVYTFNPIGAGHVTPAISLAYLVTSAISPLKWALYLAAQLLGALIATGFVDSVNYDHFGQAQGGANVEQPGYNAGASLGIEVLTTTILVLTALSFRSKQRCKASAEFGPVALGFVVLTVHLIALPINGASMNPARSFASSAVFHQWVNQWTYWLGPALGALIAVFWHELFLRERAKKHIH